MNIKANEFRHKNILNKELWKFKAILVQLFLNNSIHSS
jgi:hypothetical protein